MRRGDLAALGLGVRSEGVSARSVARRLMKAQLSKQEAEDAAKKMQKESLAAQVSGCTVLRAMDVLCGCRQVQVLSHGAHATCHGRRVSVFLLRRRWTPATGCRGPWARRGPRSGHRSHGAAPCRSGGARRQGPGPTAPLSMRMGTSLAQTGAPARVATPSREVLLSGDRGLDQGRDRVPPVAPGPGLHRPIGEADTIAAVERAPIRAARAAEGTRGLAGTGASRGVGAVASVGRGSTFGTATGAGSGKGIERDGAGAAEGVTRAGAVWLGW